MRLFSFISGAGLIGLTLLTGLSCARSKVDFVEASAEEQKAEQKSDVVERYYFVKGMHCSGCKLGVRAALQDPSLKIKETVKVDNNSPEPENKIGHAVVRFLKEDYRGQETDCKVAKKIKEDLGYMVYWDKSNINPCKI